MAIGTMWSPQKALCRAWAVVAHTWYLGFTAFGGPPVHFKIFHDRFVTKLNWVDEQMYQELFAICQAFPGPGSTKMLYCIILLHEGFVAATVAFLIWSIPGALGMYALSVGVSHLGDSLPRAVYAFLSGLNAAVVGTIVLAAVQLSQKAVTDKFTRILVFLGATAGLMYNALWYFPLLLFLAGCAAVVYDFRWVHPALALFKGIGKKRVIARGDQGTQLSDLAVHGGTAGLRVPTLSPSASTVTPISDLPISTNEASQEHTATHTVPEERQIKISWQVGALILGTFAISFIIFMVLRGTLPNTNLLYRLFANMYLAGTIIFGGGPVVIPLLREYIVAEGWVSPRDFLIGLAIIQAFPGPNFNFAVYLGSLTAIGGGYLSFWGAVLGYLGIFVPGLMTVHGEMGLWSALRSKRWVKSALRGINSAAVGLIYTAVYRLWQIGFIDEGFQAGKSLGDDPWWVVVAATSYVGGMWFRLDAPFAILLGAIMGLIRYGVVSTQGY